MLCVCFLKENMSAFCVETQERALVFAALKDDCLAWVDKLCHSTFQVGPRFPWKSHDPQPGNTSSTLSICLSQQGFPQGSGQLRMEENQIYASADEGNLIFNICLSNNLHKI